MPEFIFDTRKLGPLAMFTCKLGLGNYTITSAEFPNLNGTITVDATGRGDGDAITSVMLTADGQGNLIFSPENFSPENPSMPFKMKDQAYISFSHFSNSDVALQFSLQISGAGQTIDSRTLTDGQMATCMFMQAGGYTFKAYWFVPASPDGTTPAHYVLQKQGQISVRDDASPGDPAIIPLDDTTDLPPAITSPTGYPVSWEPHGGPWYVVATITPPPDPSRT